MSSFYQRGAEKRRNLQEMRLKEKEFGSSTSTGPGSPKQGMEQEKRLRRQIANSNERRRMQSINAGFQSLKTMIPHGEGEKLSKAAILQHTTDYICQLEQIRSRLVAENNELKQLVQGLGGSGQSSASPPPKRKKRDTESSDEGIGMTCTDSDEHSIEDYKRELMEVRSQLEQERKHRMLLERKLLAASNIQDEDLTKCKAEAPVQSWLKDEPGVEASQHVPRPSVSLTPPSPLATTSSQVPPASSSLLLPNVSPSLSRRNLATIVEAIRHLEGEQALVESERGVPASCTCITHSEESGNESSYEQEDSSSDNSPRCDSQSSSSSSSSLSRMDCEINATPSLSLTASPKVHMAASHPALLHHQDPSLLSRAIPDIHHSTYIGTATYQLPLQLLTHAAAIAKPQQPPPSVVVMQKS